MKAPRLVIAALVPLALAGCGVPDIVAHGVKAYERSQDANTQAPAPAAATQPQYQPAYQPAPAAQRAPDPEPVSAPMPPRERITAEPLQ